ncbi:MAG: metallophosphoesterase family protein [Caldilineaceae bacterium]|nr:metallophosphoesterase family protein [Caldilineaceae bacterium]
MRVLVVSDKVEPILYSGAVQERVGAVDMVLSCGDLPFYYIEYLVSMLNRPTYYVFGNHTSEVEYHGQWEGKSAPHGAENLHMRSVQEGGLLLAGLEGSIRYNNAPRFQYTNSQMFANITRLAPRLLYNKLRYGRWLDVLVAHSPPRGIHDEEDRAHQGFESFLTFMRWFKPRYLLHGHIHIYRQDTVTQTSYHETEVINVYPYRILELEPAAQIPANAR